MQLNQTTLTFAVFQLLYHVICFCIRTVFQYFYKSGTKSKNMFLLKDKEDFS